MVLPFAGSVAATICDCYTVIKGKATRVIERIVHRGMSTLKKTLFARAMGTECVANAVEQVTGNGGGVIARKEPHKWPG